MVYGITVKCSDGRSFELELHFDHRGTWMMKGEAEIERAIGPDLWSDWLINFWAYNPLGRHVWRLGNPPIKWEPIAAA